MRFEELSLQNALFSFSLIIRGPMRNKTVILVTNALQYLPHADNILWMDNGIIKGQGTYGSLVEQGRCCHVTKYLWCSFM